MDIQNPRTVFYHAPCLDGAVAAWAVYKTYGDTARYIGLDHADYDAIKNTILQNIGPDSIAVFVDFAPRRDILVDIIDKLHGIEVYDHHVTAEKDLLPYMDHPKCKIVFDMKRSGAGIAFDQFAGMKIRPLFINLVERLDLFQPEKFKTRDQFYAVAAFLDRFDVGRNLSEIMSDIDRLCEIEDIGYFEQAGYAQRQESLTEIGKVLQKIDFIDISTLETARGLTQVPIVKAELHDLGHEFMPLLMSHCPHPDKMAICWSYHNADTIKMSLRSDSRIDVSLMAEELGRIYGLNGGGHKGISAVRFTVKQFREFARMTGLDFH